MSGLKLIGKDRPEEPESQADLMKRLHVPGSYCVHRSVRAVVPSPIDGMPQSIETPMPCRRDCMHYLSDVDPDGTVRRGGCDLGQGRTVR